MESKCCGTCRWFVVEAPYTIGDCTIPVPDCVSYADRAGMDIDHTDCPCYSPKPAETKEPQH